MNVDRNLWLQKTIAGKAAPILVPLVLCFFLSSAHAQAAQQQNPGSTSLSPGAIVNLQSVLAQIDQSAQSAALDIAKLRIEKWKADSNSKQQAQSNADSLQRNLSNALPTLTSGVRTSPQAFAPTFKLYRNLTALYDVLSGLTESAGAFGPNQDFDSLKQDAEAFDGYRRSLGDYIETLAAKKDSDLTRVARPQQPVSSAPKKVIVDNDPTPVKKKTKKKAPPPQ